MFAGVPGLCREQVRTLLNSLAFTQTITNKIRLESRTQKPENQNTQDFHINLIFFLFCKGKNNGSFKFKICKFQIIWWKKKTVYSYIYKILYCWRNFSFVMCSLFIFTGEICQILIFFSRVPCSLALIIWVYRKNPIGSFQILRRWKKRILYLINWPH